MPPERIAKVLEDIGKRNPFLATYINDRLSQRPSTAYGIYTMLQQMPLDVKEQIEKDIEYNEPTLSRVINMIKDTITYQQPQQSQQQTVDMRPQPNVKPPRRESRSI
jgi:hypothetical protein